MYEFFRGRVAHVDAVGNLSFEVAGVGYLLRVSETTRQSLPLDGSEVVVHARLVVRDGDPQLFGFADPAERAAFDLLTGVQGVGPVVALGVLSAYPVADLRRVLLGRDVAALKKVKGVGAKSAERMTLELHDKVDRIPAAAEDLAAEDRPASTDAAHDLARQALVALGFGGREVATALDQVAVADANSEDLVRAALAVLRAG